jgi:Fe-S cluster assembly protein SufB
MGAQDINLDLTKYKLGWHDDVDYVFKPKKGLSDEVIREMSWMKGEPDWMLNARLRSLDLFDRRPLPSWLPHLTEIDFDNIFYYIKPTAGQVDAWEDLPEAVKQTYEKLGIPEAERKYLAGVTAQYESEVVFHRNREDLERMGVIFCDMDTALREYPELVKQYWGKVIPPNDNKFAALNTSVWSGGSFIYVPPGVEVDMPLQAYFRINAENMGQFERTLIIADEGSKVHYIEGCLLEGERIELSDGSWLPVEDIAPNDLVVGHDGKPATVVDVMKRDYAGRKHTIVPLSSANAFTVTSEHPILAVPRTLVRAKRPQRKEHWLHEVDTKKIISQEPEWIRADQLQTGDFIVFPKRLPDPTTSDLGLPFMRLAGYFLAEGHCSITNGCKSLIFSFHIDEKEYIEEVRNLSEELWGKRGSVYEDPSKHEARITVYTNEGYDLMLQHCGTGSAIKQVSPEIFNQKDGHVMALIDAYVNGDGNRNETKDGEWIRCHTISKNWAFQLQALMARVGIFATLRLSHPGGAGTILGREINRQDLWVIQWRTNKKMSEVRDAGEYFLVPVKSIETEDFEGPVFNFETENVHSYLVKGFATHNCSAPVYTTDSLHSAVVEIIVKPSARVTYTTIQNWSNNVFNLVTKRARVEAEGHMEWIDGNIGCLASGSKVYTPSGPKAIEDIAPGEQVVSFDGSQLVWAKVTAKKFSGVQPVHEVKCGERRILATANHPFYGWSYDPGRPAKLGRYSYDWIRVDEIAETGKILVPNTSMPFGEDVKVELPALSRSFAGGNQYQEKFSSERSRTRRLNGEMTVITDDIAWLLGAYIGDGSIETKEAINGGLRWARMTLAIPTTKRSYGKMLRVMRDLCPDVEPKLRGDGRATRWSSVELVEWMQSVGVSGLATTKRVPDWIFSAPEHIRVAFICGYIDTDGHVSGTQISIKSVNKDLLGDVAALLSDMGIYSRINTEFEGEKEVKILDYTAISRGSHLLTMDADPRIVDAVCPEIRDRLKISHHSMRRTIGRSSLVVPDELDVRSVTVSDETQMLPTWDVEVEGTGCFVAEGFLVHNSQLTAKYPAVYMVGPKASGEVLSVAYAGAGQHQDTGAKMVHAAPETTSRVVSKSISKDGGRTSYRGLIRVEDGAYGCKSRVECDALILDELSASDTYPYMEIATRDAVIGHEASISKVADEQLFYLMSRGMSEEQAMGMIVNGFIEPVTRTLPMEYAVEWSRLIELQMDGSVG